MGMRDIYYEAVCMSNLGGNERVVAVMLGLCNVSMIWSKEI